MHALELSGKTSVCRVLKTDIKKLHIAEISIDKKCD